MHTLNSAEANFTSKKHFWQRMSLRASIASEAIAILVETASAATGRLAVTPYIKKG